MNHCKDGQGCTTGDDCENFACVNKKCCTPSDFGKQCGGDCGVKCPDSGACGGNNDCQSGLCNQGTCSPSGQSPPRTPG